MSGPADTWQAVQAPGANSLRLVVAVAIAACLCALVARSLTIDRSYLAWSITVIGVLAVVTAVLARSRHFGPATVTGPALTLIFQLAVLSGALTLLSRRLSGTVGQLWHSGLDHIRGHLAPMPPNPGVTVILVAAVGLIFILTDVIARSLAAPAWSIVPLGGTYLIPQLALGIDSSPTTFAACAVGYLGILLADGLNIGSAWTRGLAYDSAPGGTGAPVAWRAAALIGIPAIVSTLLLVAVIPTPGLPGLTGTLGRSGGSVALSDPTLDLRRNLAAQADTPVLSYRADQPDGTYLRLASLDTFDANGWHASVRQFAAGTQLSAIPGLAAEPPTKLRTSDISIGDFDSPYLPLPYAPRSFDILSPTQHVGWAYDPDSLVVVATGPDQEAATHNLHYTVRSADLTPTAAELASTHAGQPPVETATDQLPADFPVELRDLTARVTRGTETDAAAAWAIQRFLRDPGNFTYSTRPLPGSGYEALTNFLLRDHLGYCEQFAAAMAVMARAAGIPARVSVGFLPGTRGPEGAWEVTAHDMHAWPELYFEGLGWVRFEPTPASVTGSPPAWTLPAGSVPGPAASEAASQQSTQRQTADSDSQSASPSAAPTGAVSADRQGPRLVGFGVALGVALLAVACLPALMRIGRRRRRLQLAGNWVGDDPKTQTDRNADRVEAVWAELRDTVIDLGDLWPSGSPRQIGAAVGAGLPVDAATALGQLVACVEQARYAPTVEDSAVAALPAQLERVVRALMPTSRSRRLRLGLWPKSVFYRHARA